MASSVAPTAQVVPGTVKATNVLYNAEDQFVSGA